MKQLILYIERTTAVLGSLKDNQAGLLFRRLLAYSSGDDKPSGDPLVDAMFEVLKLDLDGFAQQYEKVCERNRMNGQKGGRPRKPNETQENPENPVGFLETQENPKKPNISISINRNINNNKDILTDISSTETVDAKPKKIDIDFAGVAKYWNDQMNGTTICQVLKITPKRKSAILSRAEQYGKEAIKKAIDKVRNSNFLKGGGKTNFKATFDWVFLPNNFIKIIEGDYDDNKTFGTGIQPTKKYQSATDRFNTILGLQNNDEPETGI